MRRLAAILIGLSILWPGAPIWASPCGGLLKAANSEFSSFTLEQKLHVFKDPEIGSYAELAGRFRGFAQKGMARAILEELFSRLDSESPWTVRAREKVAALRITPTLTAASYNRKVTMAAKELFRAVELVALAHVRNLESKSKVEVEEIFVYGEISKLLDEMGLPEKVDLRDRLSLEETSSSPDPVEERPIEENPIEPTEPEITSKEGQLSSLELAKLLDRQLALKRKFKRLFELVAELAPDILVFNKLLVDQQELLDLAAHEIDHGSSDRQQMTNEVHALFGEMEQALSQLEVDLREHLGGETLDMEVLLKSPRAASLSGVQFFTEVVGGQSVRVAFEESMARTYHRNVPKALHNRFVRALQNGVTDGHKDGIKMLSGLTDGPLGKAFEVKVVVVNGHPRLLGCLKDGIFVVKVFDSHAPETVASFNKKYGRLCYP